MCGGSLIEGRHLGKAEVEKSKAESFAFFPPPPFPLPLELMADLIPAENAGARGVIPAGKFSRRGLHAVALRSAGLVVATANNCLRRCNTASVRHTEAAIESAIP